MIRQFKQYEVYEGEKIKGSRFIATCVPVSSLIDVRNVISSLQSEHPNANHHCWAVRFADGQERSNDDGEPGGSAGQPILQRIQRAELVNSLVVVTRYFGGTKLGVGGLIRAYGGAACEAIQTVEIQTMTSVDIVELEFAYSDQSILRTVVHASNGIFDVEVYTDVVSWRVLLHPEFSTIFTEQCFDRTSGRVMPQINGQKLIMIES